MCVIAICGPGVRPTAKQVRKMFESNNDGAGVAWTSKGGVKFRKGLMALTDALTVIGSVPETATMVIHFRISTVGGTVEELTHPFVVSEDSDLRLRGRARAVLFHNGHWNDWQQSLLQSTISTPGGAVPDGALSDSRAMAVLAHRHGDRIGALIPNSQKVAVLTEDGVVVTGLGWGKVGEMQVSNTYWQAGRVVSPLSGSYKSYGGFKGHYAGNYASAGTSAAVSAATQPLLTGATQLKGVDPEKEFWVKRGANWVLRDRRGAVKDAVELVAPEGYTAEGEEMTEEEKHALADQFAMTRGKITNGLGEVVGATRLGKLFLNDDMEKVQRALQEQGTTVAVDDEA